MLETERRFGMHITTGHPAILHHWFVEFKNGYKASIHEWNFEADSEEFEADSEDTVQYEIGIFHNDEFCMQPILDYAETPIRHLSESQVAPILDALAQLPYTPTNHEHVL